MKVLCNPSIARGSTIRWAMAAALVSLCFTGAAWGSLLWDGADTVTAGAQGGTGTWNTTNTNWWDGTADVAWSSAQQGVFGATAGTVTAVGTLPVATGLQFSTSGYTVTGGTLTLSGTPTITTDSAVTGTINSIIGGTVGLTKEGSGTLILGGTGTNTYSGTTTLNAGAVGLTKASALGTSTATVNGGTTLFIGTAAANTTVANSITLAGGRLGAAAGLVGGHIYSGTITLADATTSTVDQTDVLDPATARRMRISGAVTGSGTLNISGIATGFTDGEFVQLYGNNTFTGTINIDGGGRVLANTNVNALGSSTATVNVNDGGFLEVSKAALLMNNVAVKSGGTLRISLNPGTTSAGTVPTAPIAGTLQIACAVDTAFDGVKMADGSVLAGTSSGASYAADMELQGQMEIATSGYAFTVNGALSGAGGFTKTGDYRLQLGGLTTLKNTYAGTTTVNAGELYLQKSFTGNTVAVPGDLVIGDGTGTDTVTVAFDEQIADTSAVTINSGGKLVLNEARNEHIGSLSGSGGVTLTFTTIAAAQLTANDGIAPGSGAGTLTIDGNGHLVLGASSNSVFELGLLAGTNDQVLLLGTTSLALAGDLTVEDLGGMQFGDYTLFDLATGTVVGSFDHVYLPTGYAGTVSTASGDVVLTIIPEPATLALLVLGAFAMLRRRRGGN